MKLSLKTDILFWQEQHGLIDWPSVNLLLISFDINDTKMTELFCLFVSAQQDRQI